MRRQFIENMFAAVDASDWDRLQGFYHPQCSYDRPGFAAIEGVGQLMRFYSDERPIKSGLHRVDAVLEEDGGACAFGAFDGRLRTGEAISLRFADRYVFDGEVIRARTTYFYAPLA
jgi:ketosteroid isomerase-like protein